MKATPSSQVEPAAADPKKFTGTVVQETILEAQTEGGMRVFRFSYEPEAWSRWHTHDGEQALYVLSGSGAIIGTDGQVIPMGAGDAVYVEPGMRHWHGAARDQFLVHLAFNASGGTEWAEEVTPEAYRSAFGQAS